MRWPWPISATEAVPGSVRIVLQVLGYATLAAPDGSWASFHPRGGETSSTWFHDDAWLDFNMHQKAMDWPKTS